MLVGLLVEHETEDIRVLSGRVARQPHVQAIRPLVELDFSLAAQKSDGLDRFAAYGWCE
jgi:hypothetical protein